MDDQERRERGEAMRRNVLGDSHVDRATATTTPLTAEFQDLITRHAWGEIWVRPGLAARDRRLLVIGTLVALGHWDELAMHVRAAVAEGGLTADEVKEVVLQQAIYCGLPAANAAFRVVRAVLESGAAPTPLATETGETADPPPPLATETGETPGPPPPRP